MLVDEGSTRTLKNPAAGGTPYGEVVRQDVSI